MDDYNHAMSLCQELLPDKDWERINEDWPGFSSLDHGDNEPFAIMREALLIAVKQRADCKHRE